MTNRLPPTLFQQALGAAFYSLAPALRQLHGVRGQARYAGTATIERGSGPLARLCARLTHLPASASDLPTTVLFTADAGREIWRREFGSQRMQSTLVYRDGLLHEHLGAARLRFFLHARDGALWWQVDGVRVFGWLPLPARWFDRLVCREREWQGRYEFLVDLTLPVIGRIIRYEGLLQRVDDGRH